MSFYGECKRKRRYATKAEAREVASGRDVHLRTYRCHHCWGWHLTSDIDGKTAPRATLKPRKVDWHRERQRWLRKAVR